MCDIEYFLDDLETNDIFACFGKYASDGIFRLRVSNPRPVWEFVIPSSIEWDSIHQRIYRNFRTTKITSSTELSALPSLPPVPQGPFPKWEDQFLLGEPVRVTKFPLTAATVIEQESGCLKVFIVLYEDTYETSHGDGKFLYIKNVFLSNGDAERFAIANQEEWIEYHFRRMTIKLDKDRFTFPDFALELFDHFGPEEVLETLERYLQNKTASG